MWKSTGRRTTIEIVADILRLLCLGVTGTTEITCTVKVSRDQASKYLNWLFGKGLLEEIEKEIGVPSYRITKKGLSLLSKIENLQKMLPPNEALDFLHRSRLMEITVPDNRIVESSEIEEN
jgi:predicted transcriptional regulator